MNAPEKEMDYYDALPKQIRRTLRSMSVKYDAKTIWDYLQRGIPEADIIVSLLEDDVELRAKARAERAA